MEAMPAPCSGSKGWALARTWPKLRYTCLIRVGHSAAFFSPAFDEVFVGLTSGSIRFLLHSFWGSFCGVDFPFVKRALFCVVGCFSPIAFT